MTFVNRKNFSAVTIPGMLMKQVSSPEKDFPFVACLNRIPFHQQKIGGEQVPEALLELLNMARLGENVSEGIRLFTQTVQSDLQELLNTSVQVCFHEKLPDRIPFDFEGYTLLEEIPLNQETEFTEYNEAPALLRQTIQPGGEIKVYSNLLRSNCKITKQPDWGTLYVWIKAQQLPSPVSLLKYIVSLRNENHFHEEICEMTYKRLWDLFHPGNTFRQLFIYSSRRHRHMSLPGQ